MSRPPLHVRPSYLHLPPGDWPTVLDCLCARFPRIPRQTWEARMARGLVLDDRDNPLDATTPYREAMRVRYFREIDNERRIPFEAQVLHQDRHLLVADKPHFLPVMPAGDYAEETLLTRLVRDTGNPHLAPLHRIDRHTAGLVLFSADPASRGAYQALFREKRIDKRYQAIAPALPQHEFPLRRHSRLEKGEPFFRMREVAGEPNSETLLEVLERRDDLWRYRLFPVTGKQHQLRVHMAALGAPILNDTFYPELVDEKGVDDFARPLKLLAHSLAFTDPLSGEPRRFESRIELEW
ncbi:MULTISPECIES: pseudouridine synthase [unclassified Pseudomonas]|uniref:pseudouridine synthase n=1 Tax=unclassified Pseudomonas TaxID=196821 RepID=UPI002446C609|nr:MULTISPECIES: pseudouridine synthase [unclassified Pseudomonas]MDH0896429.1 pseudouridine synthase [Pseudomonas sp. GD03875]MDH1066826.1 pseudouridine synthase [Pseudomonas sp. GD03985]